MRKSDKSRMPKFEENFNTVLDYMTNRHRRVLPVRLDLTFPKEYNHDGGNMEVRKFHKRIEQHYRNQRTELRYHTVREQASSTNPHYHVMLLLDGDRVRSPKKVQNYCNETWKNVVNHDGDGLVDYCIPRAKQSRIKKLQMIYRPPSTAAGDDLETQQRRFEDAKGHGTSTRRIPKQILFQRKGPSQKARDVHVANSWEETLKKSDIG